jgi:hypothetical protein
LSDPYEESTDLGAAGHVVGIHESQEELGQFSEDRVKLLYCHVSVVNLQMARVRLSHSYEGAARFVGDILRLGDVVKIAGDLV